MLKNKIFEKEKIILSPSLLLMSFSNLLKTIEQERQKNIKEDNTRKLWDIYLDNMSIKSTGKYKLPLEECYSPRVDVLRVECRIIDDGLFGDPQASIS